MTKKLYRSRDNKIIAGVAGGIGDYFQIDPSLIRILFILSGVFGAGIIIYIVAAIIMPRQEDVMGHQYRPDENEWGSSGFETRQQETPVYQKTQHGPDKGKLVIGIGLILFGLLFLIKQIFPFIHFNLFWPLLVIAIGLFFIFKK